MAWKALEQNREDSFNAIIQIVKKSIEGNNDYKKEKN